MRNRTLHAVVAVAAVFTASIAADLAAQQQYPTKIIRVVNPNQPGGNSDVLFRLLSPKMGEILGQQLVIDYRPGAGGNIGAEMVSKAAPDGYTTLIAAASFLINPSLLKNLPFDAVKDFTPLGLIVDIPAALLTHPSLPVKNVKELIALAKARPGELNFSSSGRGALGHLSGALLSSMTGINMVHIPYKGAGPAIVDLVAGHVQLSFVSIPAVVGHVQAGRLRMLAQCGATRFPSFPNLPTMQESGVPGFVVSSGFSFLGPAGMPQPIVAKLNGALAQTLRDPAIRKTLIDRGAEPIGNTPAEHAAFIKSEIEKWRQIARSAGLKPE
ncbi:MAG: tripartite tricarboxylate transporter substrate binding protein [Betaproteobacteria bacterium]|nr:tripartite tricarboxylate transporter substrate binding protein [Betaproteobacteria bacterium]